MCFTVAFVSRFYNILKELGNLKQLVFSKSLQSCQRVYGTRHNKVFYYTLMSFFI